MFRPVVAALAAVLCAACGPPPGIITAERVSALKVDISPHGVWICDRFAGGWGGSLREGVEFGAWVGEHNVTVVIPSGEPCVSAAALAAMGAAHMVKHPLGMLAFHGPTPPLDQAQRNALLAILLMQKVPLEAALRIRDLEPGEWWTPRGAELEQLLEPRR